MLRTEFVAAFNPNSKLGDLVINVYAVDRWRKLHWYSKVWWWLRRLLLGR